MSKQREYWNTRFLAKRYNIDPRTLYRWMNRASRPFPKPIIKSAGSQNLFCKASVLEWEERMIERSRLLNGSFHENGISTRKDIVEATNCDQF